MLHQRYVECGEKKTYKEMNNITNNYLQQRNYLHRGNEFLREYLMTKKCFNCGLFNFFFP